MTNEERDYYIKVGDKWHPVIHWNKDTGLPEEVSPIGFTTEEVKSRECHFMMTGSYDDETIKPFTKLLESLKRNGKRRHKRNNSI